MGRNAPGRYLPDSMQSRVRIWMHKHAKPCTAASVAEGIDATPGLVSQVLANLWKKGFVERDLIDGARGRYVYNLTPDIGLPNVATPRFNPAVGLPKPYTPPPVPPRRPVMTAPSLSQIQHDAAVARAAADAPAIAVAANVAPADDAPLPAPITSVAALQHLERTLELPELPAPSTPAPPAPTSPAPAVPPSRPDTQVIDDADQGEPHRDTAAAMQARLIEQLDEMLGPVPDGTPPAPPTATAATVPGTPSLRCALRSDGCLCIEFTQSDEAFWLTRAETRVLADYLFSFRVQPLERLTAEGLTCA